MTVTNCKGGPLGAINVVESGPSVAVYDINDGHDTGNPPHFAIAHVVSIENQIATRFTPLSFFHNFVRHFKLMNSNGWQKGLRF